MDNFEELVLEIFGTRFPCRWF